MLASRERTAASRPEAAPSAPHPFGGGAGARKGSRFRTCGGGFFVPAATPEGVGVNALTSPAITDLGEGNVLYSARVDVARVEAPIEAAAEAAAKAAAPGA